MVGRNLDAMNTLSRLALPLSTLLLLAACGGIANPFQRADPGPSVAVMSPDGDTVRPQTRPRAEADAALSPLARTAARTADTLDRTTPEERAAATAPATGGQRLGETLASLGNPAEGGFWLRTGLVSEPRPGRVQAPGGASAQVELRPSGNAPGAGSQRSLAAVRAMALSLTDLHRLEVFTR